MSTSDRRRSVEVSSAIALLRAAASNPESPPEQPDFVDDAPVETESDRSIVNRSRTGISGPISQSSSVITRFRELGLVTTVVRRGFHPVSTSHAERSSCAEPVALAMYALRTTENMLREAGRQSPRDSVTLEQAREGVRGVPGFVDREIATSVVSISELLPVLLTELRDLRVIVEELVVLEEERRQRIEEISETLGQSSDMVSVAVAASQMLRDNS
jgi:hypothetical protein